MTVRIEKQIGAETLVFETGKLAKQADGSVVVSYGGSSVLVTAQSADPRQGIDFFPLTVDYRERFSAAGKFPGGFIKREGRPSNREVLTSRLTDRPIRPLFPEGYKNEVQIIGTLLSVDDKNDPDVLAITGASAALSLSTIPFLGPIAAVRVGLIDDEFVINPTFEERSRALLDLVVAGSRDAILMVEAGAKEVPEEDVLEALQFGHEAIREILPMIEELARKAGKPKLEFVPEPGDTAMHDRIHDRYLDDLRRALQTEGKLARYGAIDGLRAAAVAGEIEGIADENQAKKVAKAAKAVFDEMAWKTERAMILEQGRRADGRDPEEIRQISVEVALLARTHGSALFTRGETQALVTAVLGTGDDEQRVENAVENFSKHFYLDYNFPPFSVGEVRPVRGPGRREIGHGALAERAILAMLPDREEFAYTMRIVSEILESNGSSSMATVCGATMALMDAGVPIKAPVAGIAMGLVTDGSDYKVLSDIAGSEDHNGDMDFKVAGTRKGITALQMDIKLTGLQMALLEEALEQARKGRHHILDRMLEALDKPRAEVSPLAPRLERVSIPVDKIGALIGPGGRQVKAIQEETGANVEIGDDGVVLISGPSAEVVRAAVDMVRAVTAEIEVGAVYNGKVVSIKDFGAFVEIAPGQEGLCHVSELSTDFVRDVTEVVNLGDQVKVKVIDVDPTGRIRLSRKALMLEEGGAAAGSAEASAGSGAGPAEGRGGFDRGRGPRRDDRGPRSHDRGDRGPRRDDRGPRRDDRGDRGPRRDDRGPRRDDRGGGRGFDRWEDARRGEGGDRGGERSERPDREPRFDRPERPERSDRPDRPERTDRFDRDRPKDEDDRPRGPRKEAREDFPPEVDDDNRGNVRDDREERGDRGPGRDDRRRGGPRRDRR